MANYVQLFVHFVWATAERAPLLIPDVEAQAHACLANKCQQLRCRPIAIGGMPDHVHVLVELHLTATVATLAKEMKGASSHYLKRFLTPNSLFQWQVGYGAFSIRQCDVPTVATYVREQRLRHATSRLLPELERIAAP